MNPRIAEQMHNISLFGPGPEGDYCDLVTRETFEVVAVLPVYTAEHEAIKGGGRVVTFAKKVGTIAYARPILNKEHVS